jgi:hypothetical protein
MRSMPQILSFSLKKLWNLIFAEQNVTETQCSQESIKRCPEVLTGTSPGSKKPEHDPGHPSPETAWPFSSSFKMGDIRRWIIGFFPGIPCTTFSHGWLRRTRGGFWKVPCDVNRKWRSSITSSEAPKIWSTSSTSVFSKCEYVSFEALHLTMYQHARKGRIRLHFLGICVWEGKIKDWSQLIHPSWSLSSHRTFKDSILRKNASYLEIMSINVEQASSKLWSLSS